MTILKLKLYYDDEIATLTNNNAPFASGTEYSFDSTSTFQTFAYKIKNGTLSSGSNYLFWATNRYFLASTVSTNSFVFSESEAYTAYNNLASNGTTGLEPILCITTARYYTNTGLNKNRPLIVCGNYVSKKVVNNGSTDTITVTFDPSLDLTNVNLYYRDSDGGKYEVKNDGISSDKHTFTATVPHFDISDSFAINNDYSFVVVPTLQKNIAPVAVNSADITVQYNNGKTIQTISYPSQTAGTITGKIDSDSDYSITGITQAYYQDRYGNKTVLNNLVTSKISDHEYSFSVDLADKDITYFKTNPSAKLYLSVTTQFSAGTDLTVQYNDGVAFQKLNFPNQTAGTVTGTVKAAQGYQITKVTQAGYHDRYTAKNFTNFVSTEISDTEYKVSFDVTSSDLAYIKANPNVIVEITVITENIATSATIPVKYNDGVTTQTLTCPGVKAGQKITVEINSATGYTINSVNGAYYAYSYGYRVNVTNFIATKISSYKYSVSFELTGTDIQRFDENKDYYVTIDLTTAKELGNINIDTSGLENCSVSPSAILQSTETKITLSANLGYILDGSGSYSIDGTTTSFTCNKAASYSFTATADKTVSVTFTATKVESNPASIMHSYVLDENGYNLLGKQYVQGVNSSGNGFTQYDYSKFINYLFEIPFSVPETITKPTQTISLGKVKLDVPCSYITDDTLTVDLGTLSLPIKDSTDYKVNYIVLYIPFCEPIELSTSVLGSKLSISMQINLLNESATVIIVQDNTIIVTHETEIFTDLPLYFSAGTKDTLVKTFKTQYQNTIKQAYVNIAYNKPVTDLISYATNEHGTLGNYKGFTRVTRGTIKNSINQEIDGIIIETLQQGVTIK